jgi:hypothetical protein
LNRQEDHDIQSQQVRDLLFKINDVSEESQMIQTKLMAKIQKLRKHRDVLDKVLQQIALVLKEELCEADITSDATTYG